MKNSDIHFSISGLVPALGKIFKRLNAYNTFIFFIFIATLYGFIVWRINVYSKAPANQYEVTTKTAAQPHIDPSVVQKIQDLQNNSVNAKSLFNQARENPFQE